MSTALASGSIRLLEYLSDKCDAADGHLYRATLLQIALDLRTDRRSVSRQVSQLTRVRLLTVTANPGGGNSYSVIRGASI